MTICNKGHLAPKTPLGGCLECNRARHREYYHRNRDHELAAANKYNANHREEKRDYTKEYYETHPKNKQSRLASYHKRRALKLNSTGSYTQKDIQRILESQDCKCVGCQEDISKSFTIDHIVALSKGGSNLAENIQLLCLACNCQKGARSMEEWQKERTADASR